jgi:hypothetical protein
VAAEVEESLQEHSARLRRLKGPRTKLLRLNALFYCPLHKISFERHFANSEVVQVQQIL